MAVSLPDQPLSPVLVELADSIHEEEEEVVVFGSSLSGSEGGEEGEGEEEGGETVDGRNPGGEEVRKRYPVPTPNHTHNHTLTTPLTWHILVFLCCRLGRVC